MNLQDELQKIHHQYGTSEKSNYEIEKIFNKEKEKLKRFYNLVVAEDEQSEIIYLNEKIKRTDLEFLKDSNDADA